jgi:hypothetical protein
MKKLTLGTALASLLALAACGETDTREKHRYTVEVEVTEPSGKVQKVSKECNQLYNLSQIARKTSSFRTGMDSADTIKRICR